MIDAPFPMLYQMQMEGLRKGLLVYLDKDMKTLIVKKKVVR